MNIEFSYSQFQFINVMKARVSKNFANFAIETIQEL